jgi:hypothetical protein
VEGVKADDIVETPPLCFLDIRYRERGLEAIVTR